MAIRHSQFVLLFKILPRCLIIALVFISVREYAYIVIGFDILLRGYIVGGGKQAKIKISLTCLYLGSDNALDKKDKYIWGSF